LVPTRLSISKSKNVKSTCGPITIANHPTIILAPIHTIGNVIRIIIDIHTGIGKQGSANAEGGITIHIRILWECYRLSGREAWRLKASLKDPAFKPSGFPAYRPLIPNQSTLKKAFFLALQTGHSSGGSPSQV
jgi:hypothetical protein